MNIRDLFDSIIPGIEHFHGDMNFDDDPSYDDDDNLFLPVICMNCFHDNTHASGSYCVKCGKHLFKEHDDRDFRSKRRREYDEEY